MFVSIDRPNHHAGNRRRRGIALVWLALALVALIGLVALGIDMGRMQLARTELQTAADAAARAAAWPIPQLEFAQSVARAEGVIAANDAGGGAIGFDVDSGDLEYGIWWRSTRTFEPLPPELLNRSNAVRIITHRDEARGNPLPMGFARIVNFDEANLRAGAIAQIRGGRTGTSDANLGIYGIDWVRTNGTTRTDSYDPTQGPYDPNTAGDGGGLGTNGWMEIIGTTWINGDTRWGPDGDTSPATDYLEVWPNADIDGWQAPLDEDLVFPPATVPTSYNNQPLINAGILTQQGDINVTGREAVTIPGGTAGAPNVYVVRNIVMRSNTSVIVNGAVEIYVTGTVDMTGNVEVNDANGISNPLPSNFKIFVVGGGGVDVGGGSALYAQIYAPQSNVRLHGTGDEFGLFGGVVGRTVDIRGNSAIHVDETLRWPGQTDQPFYVELVR